MTHSPKVSVLIPTHNYARYLDESIQSVLKQTLDDYEIVVVDNNSTDNTDEVVQKFLSHKNFFYYKNSKNLGLVGNFNQSLDYANGKYLKILCADDLLCPTNLEKCVSILDADSSISLVVSSGTNFGLVSSTHHLPLLGKQSGHDVVNECLRNGKGNWIGSSTLVMFRKRDLLVGKFNPQYNCLADLDMWFRLLAIGDCYLTSEKLAFMRAHEGQVSEKKSLTNCFEEYYFFRNIKKKVHYNVHLPELNIDKVLKIKARKCLKRSLRILPHFYKKGNLALTIQAVKIGIAELTTLIALTWL